MFEVLKEVEVSKEMLKKMVDNARMHVYDRKNRFDLLDMDTLKIWKSFFVDKGHLDGIEVHVITWNAEVIICNVRDRSAITMLNARPAQVKRYTKETIPTEIWEKAKLNVELGLNNI